MYRSIDARKAGRTICAEQTSLSLRSAPTNSSNAAIRAALVAAEPSPGKTSLSVAR